MGPGLKLADWIIIHTFIYSFKSDMNNYINLIPSFEMQSTQQNIRNNSAEHI